MKNTCIDCGTNISSNAKRCRPCDNRHRWAQPEYNKRVSIKIKQAHNTPETRAKDRATALVQWAQPNSTIRRAVTSPKFRDKISAIWRNPKKRRNMLEGIANRYRRDAGNLELIIKNFLDENFTDVIHQYVPDENMSPGVYDFYIPAIDTIIEVDGNYWHTLDSKQKRDKEKEMWALDHEYNFIRITEDEAKSPKYLISLLKEMRVQ